MNTSGCGAVEAIAAEGYRSGAFTECQLMRLLQLPSRLAVHEWLRDHGIPYRFIETDLAEDLDNLSASGLR